ncbi:MAG: DJ-1/PfpI family protein [Hyphomicrobiales bacterium]|nr:DJ-1/PfpI family protein [Hyphomicrobiales bacterium]
MTSILIITADGCTPELDYAVFRMREEKFKVTIAAPKKRRLHVVLHQQEAGWDTYAELPWYTMDADAALDAIDPTKFDALLLPGGRAPEDLRNMESCVGIVRHFIESNKPIGAISRGPLILLEAGLRDTGRRLTGLSLIKPRVVLNGCTYVDARDEAVVDGNIVTVTDRPYYHVWIRAFLSLLRGTRFLPQRAANPSRVLIAIAEASSSGHYDNAYFRMLEEGFAVTTAAPVRKPTRTVIHLTGGLDGTWDPYQELPGTIVHPDASFDEIDPSQYAALIVPGGRGPEHLRLDQRCLDIVRHFYDNDKPMAFICHSTPILTDVLRAAGVKSKRLMGLDGVKADVVASGYTWVYSPGEAVTDGNIVSAWRRPDHDVWLRAFMELLERRGLTRAREGAPSATAASQVDALSVAPAA